MQDVDTDFANYLRETFEVMNQIGLLLVSGDMKRHNVMTIGWGDNLGKTSIYRPGEALTLHLCTDGGGNSIYRQCP